LPALDSRWLAPIFVQAIATFDAGLLGAYKGIDTSPLFARQCIVSDVLYLRQEVGKLRLALPQGCCPNLVAFAQSLSVS
jgi:hypothetical protein